MFSLSIVTSFLLGIFIVLFIYLRKPQNLKQDQFKQESEDENKLSSSNDRVTETTIIDKKGSEGSKKSLEGSKKGSGTKKKIKKNPQDKAVKKAAREERRRQKEEEELEKLREETKRFKEEQEAAKLQQKKNFGNFSVR